MNHFQNSASLYHWSRMKLILDDDRKVLNSNFSSCWDTNGNEVIGVIKINEYCYNVEIYLLHLDPSSGKPITDVRSSEPIGDYGFEKKGQFGPYDASWKQKYGSEEKSDSEDEIFEFELLDGNEHESVKLIPGTYYQYLQVPSNKKMPDKEYDFVSMENSAPQVFQM